MRPRPDDPASSHGQGRAVQSSVGPGEEEAGSSEMARNQNALEILARKGLCHWAQLESGAGTGWVGCGHGGSSLWGPTSHIWGPHPDQDHRLLQKSRSAAWALCREKSPNLRVTPTPSTADLGLVTLCGGILGAVGCRATSLPHLFSARSPPVVTTTDVPRRDWVKPFELK